MNIKKTHTKMNAIATLSATATLANPTDINYLVDYFRRTVTFMNAQERILYERNEAMNRLLREVKTPIMELFMGHFLDKVGKGTPLPQSDWIRLEQRITSVCSTTESLMNHIKILYGCYLIMINDCVMESVYGLDGKLIERRFRTTPKVSITHEEIIKTYYMGKDERNWIIGKLTEILSPLETEFMRINEVFMQLNSRIEEIFYQFMSTTSRDEFNSNFLTLISLPDVESHFSDQELTLIQEFVNRELEDD